MRKIKYKGETYDVYRDNDSDKVLWLDNRGVIGELLFTIDGVNVYNLFRDFPENMTKHDVEIFCEEQVFWKEFFSERLDCFNTNKALK